MRNFCSLGLMLMSMLLPLGGCASVWQSVEEPGIAVEKVQLTQRTQEGVRVEVTVRLSNPNEIALPLVYASYGVELDGLGRFELGDQTNRTLPAKGSQVVVLPAAFALPEGSSDTQGYSVWGSVEYVPPGQLRRVLTESGVPLPSASFSEQGRFE